MIEHNQQFNNYKKKHMNSKTKNNISQYEQTLRGEAIKNIAKIL